MPGSGEFSEYAGTFLDGHGHEITISAGEQFPPCEEGQTWWWHEDLPIARQMRWEAERPPRPGGLRPLIRERLMKEGKTPSEIDELLKDLH